jgi:hypothetical protein
LLAILAVNPYSFRSINIKNKGYIMGKDTSQKRDHQSQPRRSRLIQREANPTPMTPHQKKVDAARNAAHDFRNNGKPVSENHMNTLSQFAPRLFQDVCAQKDMAAMPLNSPYIFGRPNLSSNTHSEARLAPWFRPLQRRYHDSLVALFAATDIPTPTNRQNPADLQSLIPPASFMP